MNSETVLVTAGGLPPVVLPWVLGGVTLAAGYFFFLSIRPKLRMLFAAVPDSRLDDIPSRITAVAEIAFGQSKMFKDKAPGWMHALIFWGFLILLLRAAEFFLWGFFPPLYQPGGPTGGLAVMTVYYYIKDVVVVLVALACCYALYRRLVLKPKRLTLSGEGLLILLLILVIMGSDLVFDHADSATLKAAAWWAHVLTILGFVNLLPRSKHFHIITSIPNIFLSRSGRPGNGLSRLDFEGEEEDESFGVTRIEEFTWKQLLDLHTCTECGRCDVFCPALNSGKPLSPKQFTVDLREHLNTVTPALLNTPAGERDAMERPELMGGVIKDETVWSCTTCGACEEECPVMIEYVNKMIDLRRGLVMMEDRYPKELGQAFRSLETHSNPWGFPGGTRADWAKEQGIPEWDKNNPTEYLYFVGCNGSFDKRGRAISQSVADALKRAGVSFSILGNREGCTGDPARRLGNEYLFDMLAQQNAETFKEEQILKIVTHCPHCFNSLKNEYPEFGATLEVIHHSQLLESLLGEGKIAPAEAQGKTVIHDSCYMGRHNGEYDAPRRVLAEGGGSGEVLEVDTSRERGTCCGAGGARFLLEENTGTRMNHQRLDELMAGEPDTIAVSCPYCVLMLEDAARAQGRDVRVRDIAEMIPGGK